MINLWPARHHIVGIKLKFGFALIEESSLLLYAKTDEKVNIIWSNEIKI